MDLSRLHMPTIYYDAKCLCKYIQIKTINCLDREKEKKKSL